MSWVIEESRKRCVERLAERAGVSSAVALEAIIDHLEADLSGDNLPSWWPDDGGTLPISA